jgi:glycosyltransferase involved in cell wall biosynthesis
MKRIRLAWDDCFARRNPTGTGVYAARLLDQLKVSPALDMTVFGGWPEPASLESSLRRKLQFIGNLGWTHLGLPLRLGRGDFDVLHSPAYIAPIKASCPVVITVHDITYLLYPSHFAAWWRYYMKSVFPLTISSAAAIICGSEHSKRDLLASYKLSPAKLHVVPYGVDQQKFQPRAVLDAAWANQAGIRDGYVLHVGGFVERKNLPTLLQVVARLRDQGKWQNRQLVLAGAESPGMLGSDKIHQAIAELGLSANVVLPGRVPDEYLPGLYAQAALVVMPSLYEGFGFPVLEAMASGTPVVSSNTSSLPEVAGDAALLIPPTDINAWAEAVDQVLTNPALAAELRAKGLEQARQFTWQRTAAETIEVYRQLTS